MSDTQSNIRLFREPPPERIAVRQPLPSPYKQGDIVRVLNRKHKHYQKEVIVTYASGELVFVKYLASNFHLRKEDVCLVTKYLRMSE